MGLKDVLFCWRKKEDPELARRRHLLARGRITEGFITESETDAEGRTHIFYRYTVGNSDFDSSQELFGEQLQHPERYAPGKEISVRYDPHRTVNSFVP